MANQLNADLPRQAPKTIGFDESGRCQVVATAVETSELRATTRFCRTISAVLTITTHMGKTKRR